MGTVLDSHFLALTAIVTVNLSRRLLSSPPPPSPFRCYLAYLLTVPILVFLVVVVVLGRVPAGVLRHHSSPPLRQGHGFRR